MSQTLTTGSKLKGRYLIERELGRGGIGVVYLARDERLHGMPVVIKFLLDISGQNVWLTKKFMQEAEALTRINHPGVVRVIDRDEAEDGRPFFVMEFIEGQPLRQVMNVEGMDLNYAGRLTRQIGQGLHAAHRQGVFHRDLKPENIMLQRLSGSDEQVKLIDFGIAKVLDSQSGTATEVAVVAGSQQYIAPEQLLSQPVSAATDIYSFAIIVYEMITGQRPFKTSAPNYFLAMQELVKLQQSLAIVNPKALRPDLPEAAQILLLNALSFDSQRRPQNAQIFADDLARALTGQVKFEANRSTVAVPAPTPPLLTSTTEVIPTAPKSPTFSTQKVAVGVTKARSNKAVIAGLAFIMLLAAGIAGYLWFSARPKENLPVPSVVTEKSSEPERSLIYSITLRLASQLTSPLQLTAEEVFAAGDRVRLNFTTPQSGHLYIISESPTVEGARSSYNILFPSPTSNQASSQLNAGQQISIPERGEGFVFDKESGTEKLWLIWSAKVIDNLEALKLWANHQDKGEIKDEVQIAALHDFLMKNSVTEPDAQRDDVKKQTVLKGRGDLMVKLVKLEHR